MERVTVIVISKEIFNRNMIKGAIMRNWLKEIELKVLEAKMIYHGKAVIIQMSEPLLDLCMELIRTTTLMVDDNIGGTMDCPKFYGCSVIVSKEIGTYRIFVESVNDIEIKPCSGVGDAMRNFSLSGKLNRLL